MTMIIEELTAPVTVRAITPNVVQQLAAELKFCQVQTRRDIPLGPGVYLWSASWTDATFYIGCGSGANGLSSRLGNQLHLAEVAGEAHRRWETTAVDEDRVPDLLTDDSLVGLRWVPLVRAVVEHGLACFAASTPISSGVNAKQWERRLFSANRILSGNGSLLGGSAWEQDSVLWHEAHD